MRRLILAAVVLVAMPTASAAAAPSVLVGWENDTPGHESGPAPARITSLDPASGERRQVFACDLVWPYRPGCFAVDPVGSPDGHTVDYRDLALGGEWTMNADGSGAHLLPLPKDALGLTFSPGGGQVAFTTPTGLYVAYANGTGVHRIASKPSSDQVRGLRHPTWATRGRVAFLRYRSPRVTNGLRYYPWITTTSGAEPRRLMRRAVVDYALSRDGTRAAWSDHRGVWVGRPNGRDARRVTGDPDVQAISWRRDGGAIAYLSAVEDTYGSADVTIVELAHRPVRRAYRFGSLVSAPTWLG